MTLRYERDHCLYDVLVQFEDKQDSTQQLSQTNEKVFIVIFFLFENNTYNLVFDLFCFLMCIQKKKDSVAFSSLSLSQPTGRLPVLGLALKVFGVRTHLPKRNNVSMFDCLGRIDH